MTATFEIITNAIRTATVGELTNVVKQVEWTLKGTQDGQSFELPQKTVIADPAPEAFIPLAQVTAANVATWVEENVENLEAIQAHIQFVLDRQCQEAALITSDLPWAPAPAPSEPDPEVNP